MKKWQSSGELNHPLDFISPLPKVGIDSPEGPLSVSGSYLFLGSTVSEMWEAENCPHPREPLNGTPTAKIGRREIFMFDITKLIFILFIYSMCEI